MATAGALGVAYEAGVFQTGIAAEDNPWDICDLRTTDWVVWVMVRGDDRREAFAAWGYDRNISQGMQDGNLIAIAHTLIYEDAEEKSERCRGERGVEETVRRAREASRTLEVRKRSNIRGT